MKWLAVALAAAGCQPGPGRDPGDLTGVYVAMFCIVNCPLSVNLAGPDARVDDVVPLEYPHMIPENVRASRGN